MMSSVTPNKLNQDEIRAHGGIVALCNTLHRFADNINVLINASGALGSIALGNPDNQNAIREAGGIDRLCDAIRAFPENKELKCHFCIAIGNLTKDNQINKDAIREAGAIPLLTSIAGNEEISLE